MLTMFRAAGFNSPVSLFMHLVAGTTGGVKNNPKLRTLPTREDCYMFFARREKTASQSSILFLLLSHCWHPRPPFTVTDISGASVVGRNNLIYSFSNDGLSQQAVIIASQAADELLGDSSHHHHCPSGLKKIPPPGDDRSPAGNGGIRSSQCADRSTAGNAVVNRGANHCSRSGQATDTNSSGQRPPKSNIASTFASSGDAIVNGKYNNALVETANGAVGGRPREGDGPTADRRRSTKVRPFVDRDAR